MSQDRLGRPEPPRRSVDPASRAESDARASGTSVARQAFAVRFDRYFRRVYAYVSRRVPDKRACERIVSDVMIANAGLLVERTDERRALRSIKVLSDRLIELEVTRKAATSR